MTHDSETAAVLAVFEEVAAAFGALDIPRFRRCYDLPCLMVRAGQPAIAIANEANFQAFFAPILERLAAAGFARSIIGRHVVHLLGTDLALASLHWTRCRADGAEIERFGATYTLSRIAGAWRIVTLAAHGENGILPPA